MVFYLCLASNKFFKKVTLNIFIFYSLGAKKAASRLPFLFYQEFKNCLHYFAIKGTISASPHKSSIA
jgi:hypothetical protein